jgi:hypothetical protein
MASEGRTGGPAWRRDRIVAVGGIVALVAIVVGLLGTLSASPDPAPGATEPQPVLALSDVDDVRDAVGREVVAEGVEVDGVPADEGFWVETGGDPAWVQVDTAGESPFVVQPDQRVSFTGLVVAHEPDFARQPEFSEADAEALADAGAHIEVDVGDLEIVG